MIGVAPSLSAALSLSAAPSASTAQFTQFPTPIGECALVWGRLGIAGIHLPERDAAAAHARIKARYPKAVEGSAEDPIAENAIKQINALLNGNPVTFAEVELDMTGVSPFYRRVYEAARLIPAGTTCTYGELARSLAAPKAARAVGQALGRNPFAIIVPCHRVVAASGNFGGFTAWGGLNTKRRLLELEAAAEI